METWSAHQLYSEASRIHDANTAGDLRNYAEALRGKRLPVVFSLRHLANITGTNYQMLHETVNRKRESSNYRMFAIRKRSGGRRFIHAVSSELLRIQQFLNSEILQKCKPHPCSFAFHRDGGIKQCAAKHCGSRWLFQFDLTDFFYDISEIDVFHVFQRMGYTRLLAFELARLCTTKRLPMQWLRRSYHGKEPYWPDFWFWLNVLEAPSNVEPANWPRKLPYTERFGPIGALPQGAPTSPMLSNLASLELDRKLQDYAQNNQLTYTRYADDITFSAGHRSVRRGRIRRDVINIIRRAGFAENPSKTRIAGPGSRKTVLGLLVDGESPRLSKQTYRRIDRLLYGTLENGFESAAVYNKFDSAYGFHNHLSGLVAYVKSVDETRWKEFSERLKIVKQKWSKESI